MYRNMRGNDLDMMQGMRQYEMINLFPIITINFLYLYNCVHAQDNIYIHFNLANGSLINKLSNKTTYNFPLFC